MSVNDELLCSFELLKPLDSSALKSHIKKGRSRRQNMLNSPVSLCYPHLSLGCAKVRLACDCFSAELLIAFPFHR